MSVAHFEAVVPFEALAPFEVVVLQSNKYLENLAGAKRAVVHVEGVPTVWCRSERYEHNENWFQLLFDQWSVIAVLQPGGSPAAKAAARRSRGQRQQHRLRKDITSEAFFSKRRKP